MLKKDSEVLKGNHVRLNPITGRYVLFVGDKTENNNRGIDPCPFCEENEQLTPPEIRSFRRHDSSPNNPGWSVRVVPDKNPLFRVETLERVGVGPYDVVSAKGANEIIIETPGHDESWLTMSADKILAILRMAQERVIDLKRDPDIRYVFFYKNYGRGTGIKIFHPHSTIIGSPVMPPAMKERLRMAKDHFGRKKRCLLCDIVREEMRSNERIVAESQHFLTVVPFAARMPYEMQILPKNHENFWEESHFVFNEHEFAATVKKALNGLDRVLRDEEEIDEEEVSYSLYFYSAPNLNAAWPNEWKSIKDDFHWYVEIVPRVKRYTSFEIAFGMNTNPLLTEETAEILRKSLNISSAAALKIAP